MQNSLLASPSLKTKLSAASGEILTENGDKISPKSSRVSLWKIVISLTILCSVFSSCSPTKINNVYFKNLQKDTTLRNLAAANYEIKIQKNDQLVITVASLSPDVAFYNTSIGGSGSTSGTSTGPTGGYLVDQNGNIQFVKLGNMHAEGLTRKELKDTIEKALVPYLRDVFVTVNFLNRHVTMMGGISPAILQLPADNMTILDALAASGGIGDKGRIDNVLVIREKGDSKEFKRLNLSDNSIFSSPYFYLQPNDVVYVEPLKVKEKISTPQIISYITAGVSLLVLILDRVIK